MSPLRVGCVVAGRVTPSWQAEFLAALSEVEGVDPVLVIVPAPPAAPPRRSPFVALYDALDRLLDRGRHRAFEPVSLDPAGMPVLELDRPGDPTPIGVGLLDRLAPGRLDLVIGLDDETPVRTLAEAARFGAWAIRFGDGGTGPGDVPGRSEMVADRKRVTATLWSVAAGVERAIDRAVCATSARSLRRTATVIAEAALGLTLGRLRSLAVAGTLPPPPPATETPDPPPAGRRALADAAFLVRSVGRIVWRSVERVGRDEFHWSIGIARREPDVPLERLLERPRFRWLPQTPDRFHADPFLVEHRGRHHLFTEQYHYRTRRGVIAVGRVDDDGGVTGMEPVLERPYHLSYPCVFEWDGVHWMIPETGTQRTVELYRCVRFPDRWALERVLLQDVDAADATPFVHEGRLWMFVAFGARNMSADTELHLFHAPDPAGPWVPHPANPVVSDVRHARPAGFPWWDQGRLIRPAQNCEARYGSALSFRRVIELTPDRYVEEPLADLTPERVAPGRRAQGTHTWNLDSRYVVTDITRGRWRRPIGRG